MFVVDESLTEKSIDCLKNFCREKRLAFLKCKSLSTLKTVNKFYNPINFSPQLNIIFDYRKIVITFNIKENTSTIVLSKVMSYQHNGIAKAIDNFRDFLIQVKKQNFYKSYCCIENIASNYLIRNLKFYKLIEEKFEALYDANSYISNDSIAIFLNELNKILNEYNFNFTPDSVAEAKAKKKVQLDAYMFPKLRFDNFEKKFYIDFLSINLNYQAYEKAKSKNKFIPHNYDLDYILHIINTFHKSLVTLLNYNLFLALKELNEENKLPIVVVNK